MEKKAAAVEAVTRRKGGRSCAPFSIARAAPAGEKLVWLACTSYSLAANHMACCGAKSSTISLAESISGRGGGKLRRKTEVAMAAPPGSAAARRLVAKGTWWVELALRPDAQKLEITVQSAIAGLAGKKRQREKNDTFRKKHSM
jgi:hypothetical protein